MDEETALEAFGAELAYDAVGSEYRAYWQGAGKGAGGSTVVRRDMVPSWILQEGVRLALVSQQGFDFAA